MRNRMDLIETPVRRWRGANNLPGALSIKPGWKHPVMAFAKVLIWQFAVEQAGSEDVLVARTDWAAFGVTTTLLLATIRRFLPDFDSICAEQDRDWNDSAKGRQLYNRLWYMYRERKGKRVLKRITAEHPQRSERLRPLVERGIKVYHNGKPCYWDGVALVAKQPRCA